MINRKNLMKSEGPSGGKNKNDFLNLNDKEKSKEKEIFSEVEIQKIMYKIKQIKKIKYSNIK